MSKVAIIGDKTSVLGFKALGLDVYALETPEEGRRIWPRIKEQDYAVVFITESFYEAMEDLIKEITQQIKPSVTVIPAAAGRTGLGMNKIRKIVETAVGADVLGKKMG